MDNENQYFKGKLDKYNIYILLSNSLADCANAIAKTSNGIKIKPFFFGKSGGCYTCAELFESRMSSVLAVAVKKE